MAATAKSMKTCSCRLSRAPRSAGMASILYNRGWQATAQGPDVARHLSHKVLLEHSLLTCTVSGCFYANDSRPRLWQRPRGLESQSF